MTNPLKVLSRLFAKHPNNIVVSELYSKMAEPLFVHPHLGEMVMRSYLSAIEFAPPGVRGEGDGSVTRYDNVAVIDISGALVAREMSVPCGTAPTSYEGLKQEFATLQAAPEIDTIIGRFDSPGGSAAQNMDLSDFIYASRDQGKRMIAMVDDMAYSAAFGIASAFDEIWVTRTSGVGSIGVVSYHVDRSEANKRAGVKVEYIYAGDKKVLGNPNEELSAEGKAVYQQEVGRLYELFTATVARNLGMSIEAVKATQAGTFHGEEAVAAGFAHKIGTFDDLLGSVLRQQTVASGVMLESEKQVPGFIAGEIEVNLEVVDVKIDEPAAKIDEPAAIDAEVEEIVEPNAKVEEIEAKLDEPVDIAGEADAKVEEPVAKIDDLDQERVNSIAAICAAADMSQASTDSLIGSGLTVGAVRAVALELTNSQDESISGVTSVTLANDQAKIKAGWDAAFAKVSKINLN